MFLKLLPILFALAKPMNLPAPNESLASTIVAFVASEQDIQNKYGLSQNPNDRNRLKRLYSETLQDLGQQPFEKLDSEGQLDYVLLRTSLETRLKNLDHEEVWYQREKAEVVPFAEAIFKLEEDRRQVKSIPYEAVASDLTQLCVQVDEAERLAMDHKPDIMIAYRAVSLIDQLQRCLDSWNRFYSGFDPMFSWWIPTPLKSLKDKLNHFQAYLREQVVGVKADDPTTIVGSPIGRDALIDELHGAMISYSPAELIEIADREYAWCEAEMIKASRDLGYGDDWKKALEHVKTLHEEPGSQPQLIKRLADEAVTYVKAHDLVTVPPLAEEAWTMEMMAPRRQLESPFFLGGRTILVSFPTDSMPQEQKEMSLKANNQYFCRATVFHELIPGHWLQQYFQARYHPYRSDLNNNPFWIEGWAFHWEMLLYNRDFVSKPEERIGMLFWRMHRSARVVFSLKYQLGEWSPQQCIDYLVEKVGHERFTAEGEVRRSVMGGYGPLYQLAYMMGALQFRSLHHDLVDSGKMTDREFHDSILRENEMPVELVRAHLTKSKLTRDFQTSWRFYPLPAK